MCNESNAPPADDCVVNMNERLINNPSIKQERLEKIDKPLKPKRYLEERISFNPSSTATQMMTLRYLMKVNGNNLCSHVYL